MFEEKGTCMKGKSGKRREMHISISAIKKNISEGSIRCGK